MSPARIILALAVSVGQDAVRFANALELLRVFFLVLAEVAVGMVSLGERFVGLAYGLAASAFFEAQDL